MKLDDQFADGHAGRASTAGRAEPGSESYADSGQVAGGSTERQGAGSDAEARTTNAGVDWIARLFGTVQEIVGSGNTLVEIYSDRMRASVRRKLVRAVLGAAAAICAVVWLGAAVLATLRGVCGGLAAAFDGRVWLGELLGGLLALTVSALGVVLYRRGSTRRELERLKTKYERMRNEHGNHEDDATRGEDGRGTARSRGSAGDPAHHGNGAASG